MFYELKQSEKDEKDEKYIFLKKHRTITWDICFYKKTTTKLLF